MNYSKTKSYFARFKRSVLSPFMAVAASCVRLSWGFVCFGYFFCGFFSFFFCRSIAFSCGFPVTSGVAFSVASSYIVSFLSFCLFFCRLIDSFVCRFLGVLPFRFCCRLVSHLLGRLVGHFLGPFCSFSVFLLFFHSVVFLATPFLLSISFSCIFLPFLQFFVCTFGCFS